MRRPAASAARTASPETTSARTDKLSHLFGIDLALAHEAVQRLVARWHPCAGVVVFNLLLDSLSPAGLVELA
jgi:hypothetical protein